MLNNSNSNAKSTKTNKKPSSGQSKQFKNSKPKSSSTSNRSSNKPIPNNKPKTGNKPIPNNKPLSKPVSGNKLASENSNNTQKRRPNKRFIPRHDSKKPFNKKFKGNNRNNNRNNGSHNNPMRSNRIFVDFSKLDINSIQDIFSKVLSKIRPDEKKINLEVDEFLRKLNLEIKKNHSQAVAMIGGSIAKGTNLKGDHDCDIFVKFNKSFENYDISSMLLRILRPFRPSPVHGSRDYFQVQKKLCYELVPVLDVENPKDAVNVTDMSPFHVGWVKKHPGFTDDIRLAKMFCKSQKVYGAESYIQGFSGHVLDILTIHYGGFLKLLKASLSWRIGEVIDPEKQFKSPVVALQKMNASKLDSPLIVIDPVLSDRNASAALNLEKFNLFREAAKQFLENPNISFFTVKPISIPTLKKSAGKNSLVILEATPTEGKTDVVGAKLLKSFTMIKNQLLFNDFKIENCDWYWKPGSNALFWFVFPTNDLSDEVKRIGPPLSEEQFVKLFKDKHKNTFVEDNRICALLTREFINPKKFIASMLKSDENIADKTKKIVMKRL